MSEYEDQKAHTIWTYLFHTISWNPTRGTQTINTTYAKPCSSYLPPSTRVIGAQTNTANAEPCPSIFIVLLPLPLFLYVSYSYFLFLKPLIVMQCNSTLPFIEDRDQWQIFSSIWWKDEVEDIPDICHEPHEHIRVNFFWPV